MTTNNALTRWVVPVPQELIDELEMSFSAGPILNDAGMRSADEVLVARFKGMKIEIFANEHPPPHFHVTHQERSGTFRIDNCDPVDGCGLERFMRNIRRWHTKHRETLISVWNETRPTDCPVGMIDVDDPL